MVFLNMISFVIENLCEKIDELRMKRDAVLLPERNAQMLRQIKMTLSKLQPGQHIFVIAGLAHYTREPELIQNLEQLTKYTVLVPGEPYKVSSEAESPDQLQVRIIDHGTVHMIFGEERAHATCEKVFKKGEIQDLRWSHGIAM